MTSKLSKKSIIIIGVILVIALAYVVFTWPKSLYNVIETNKGEVTSVEVNVNEPYLENGESGFHNYKIEVASTEDVNYEGVMTILEKAKFGADLRNLIPWGVSSATLGMKDYSMSIALCWGKDNTSYANIFLADNGDVSVSLMKDENFKIYHVADEEILDELMDYVKAHGIQED